MSAIFLLEQCLLGGKKMPEIKVKIVFSAQAELFLKNMPSIEREKLLDWFVNVRKISIGGGDICDYLRHREAKKDGRLS